MNTSSIDPAIAGVSSGSVTRLQPLPPACAEPRCRFVERGVESLESRRYKQENVHVHRVRVHEDDGPHSCQPPRCFLHREQALNCTRKDATLAEQEQERDDPNERRQGCRQSCDDSQDPATGKLEAAEQKRERHADEQRCNDRSNRNEEARRAALRDPPGCRRIRASDRDRPRSSRRLPRHWGMRTVQRSSARTGSARSQLLRVSRIVSRLPLTTGIGSRFTITPAVSPSRRSIFSELTSSTTSPAIWIR